VRTLDAFIRACGGEPFRVRAFATGLRRAAEGRFELQQERQGGGFAADMLPMLAGVMLALFGLMLALATLILRSRPDIAAFAIACVHGAFVVMLSLALAVPLFLGEDDARCTGWWPLPMRDVALARVLVVLRSVFGASLCLVTLPLLAHAVIGRVPVVSALLLALGLALQAAAASLLPVAAIAGVVALLGRRVAGRVLAGAGIATLAGVLVASALAPRWVPSTPPGAVPGSLPAPPPWAPPTWFSAWARLGDEGAPQLAGLSVALALVAAPVALRVLATRSRGDAPEIRHARPRRSLLAPATSAWLAPFARGLEGLVVRRLWLAHLREDARLLPLRWMPLVALGGAVALAFAPERALEPFASASGELPVRVAVILPVMATLAGMFSVLAQVTSADHAAAWLLAQSGLDPSRTAAAQRGVGRALFLAPIVALLALAHVLAGTAPGRAVADVLIVTLVFELSQRLFQMRHPCWPFSRPRGAPPDDAVIILACALVPLAAITIGWMALIYESAWWGKLLTAAFLLWWLRLARREHERMLRADGLRLEIADRVQA